MACKIIGSKPLWHLQGKLQHSPLFIDSRRTKRPPRCLISILGQPSASMKAITFNKSDKVDTSSTSPIQPIYATKWGVRETYVMVYICVWYTCVYSWPKGITWLFFIVCSYIFWINEKRIFTGCAKKPQNRKTEPNRPIRNRKKPKPKRTKT